MAVQIVQWGCDSINNIALQSGGNNGTASQQHAGSFMPKVFYANNQPHIYRM
jgi:hypothetical protein